MITPPKMTREMYYDAKAFMEAHKDCSDLVILNDGTPVAAVYYFGPGKDLKDFFDAVRCLGDDEE